MLVHPAEAVRGDEKKERPITNVDKVTVDVRGRWAVEGSTYNEDLGGIV